MAMSAGKQPHAHPLGGLIDALQLLVHRHSQSAGGAAAETQAVAREAVQRLQWIKRRLLTPELLVAFVGLAAPHLVRGISGGRHRVLLWAASAMGGVLMLVSDVLARGLLPPQELPVGVLTAVLGGVYLLVLLHRRSA